jgi:[CysO sulfur-carrier protein]-S-L-cysteine hydrolase
MVYENLTLDNYHIDRLKKLAICSLPFEACALLIGEKSKNESIVKNILPLNNSVQSSIAFIIDSDELFNAYQKSKKMNLDVISIFHSHPSNPYPSETDKIYMLLNPVIWVIYSTLYDTFKSFIIEKRNEIREVQINLFKD